MSPAEDSIFPLEGITADGLAMICASIHKRFTGTETMEQVSRWALDYMAKYAGAPTLPHVLNAILLAEAYSDGHYTIETYRAALLDHVDNCFFQKQLDSSWVNEFQIWGNKLKRLRPDAAPYELFLCASPRIVQILGY